MPNEQSVYFFNIVNPAGPVLLLPLASTPLSQREKGIRIQSPSPREGEGFRVRARSIAL